jgi:hypothetical protein
MKVRQGFVSNSSTTSFCIYGYAIESTNFPIKIEQLKTIKKECSEIWEKAMAGFSKKTWCKRQYELLKDIDRLTSEQVKEIEDMINDDPSEYSELYGLEFHSMSDAGMCWIGKSWRYIGADETGKQFTENIEKIVKMLVGDEAKCDTYEEAWRDG